jgi:hypothetical protein
MSDAEDAPGALTPRWEVDLHHNTHVHPSSWTNDSTGLTLVGEDHDDGTGIRLRGRFIATDTGGLRDTAWVNLFPEVDLRASAVATTPGTPGTLAPAEWSFTIANDGRMPAPWFHWQLVAGGAVLAEGDTLVPALDSVLVVRELPPSLAAGDHGVRVVVDSAGAIVETDEDDNAATRTVTVVEDPLAVGDPPAGLRLSAAWPNPSPGRVEFALELPAESVVEFAVFDVAGRQVGGERARAFGPGRHRLEWDAAREGRLSGLFFARVRAGGRELTRRFVVAR